MRRWLTIFLLVFMPLQLSWAAQHFGHHAHQHKADVDVDVERADNSSPKANGGIDADCGTCHAGCSTAIFESVSMLTLGVASDLHTGRQFRISSHPPSLPERPNWADLA